MKRQLIAKGNGFNLISINNGWAYEFGFQGEVKFFQDDDALDFRREYDSLERYYPNLNTSSILKRLWEMFS